MGGSMGMHAAPSRAHGLSRSSRSQWTYCAILLLTAVLAASPSLRVVAAESIQEEDPDRLRQEHGTVQCLDVAAPLVIARTEAIPLKELTEITTGKSCVRTSILRALRDDVATHLRGDGSVTTLDCVGTRMDEAGLGLLAVFQVCSAPDANQEAAVSSTTWAARMPPLLQKLFAGEGAASSSPLRYHGEQVQVGMLTISTSYTLAMKADQAARFKFKGAQLWVDDAIGENEDEGVVAVVVAVVTLLVRNEGTAPLHVFAVTVKMLEEAVGVVMLPANSVEPIAPQEERTVRFQAAIALDQLQVEDDREYGLYFAHSAVKAHLMEGRLKGTQLTVLGQRKSGLRTTATDSMEFPLEASVSLGDGSYSMFPFNLWRALSVAVVVAVGVVTTLFVRRKRVKFGLLGCLRTTTTNKRMTSTKTKRKKQEAPGVQMTELKRTQKKSAEYQDLGDSDEETDHEVHESDRLLTSSTLSAEKSSLRKQKHANQGVSSKFKMPAIKMQWRKPMIGTDKLSIRRGLQLDGAARLDPRQFERLWEEYLPRHSASFTAKQHPPVEALVARMATVGITCMASGTVDGVEKYMLYAKQRDVSAYFFVALELHVTTNDASVSIRASCDTSAPLLEQFTALITQQLTALMA